MISAIAARKAAALALAQTSRETGSATIDIENEGDIEVPPTRSSKRKDLSSESRASSARRKKLKVKRREVKRDLSSSSDGDEVSSPPLSQFRASTDDDEDEDDAMRVDVDLSTFFPNAPKPPSTSTQKMAPLSTFNPISGENVFPLSPAEVAQISFSSSSLPQSPPPSAIVLLPPHESICILGACNITILHGSVSLLGTSLYPSTQAHRIYAPKSSPLPVIQCSFRKTTCPTETLSLRDANIPSRIEIDEDVTKYGAVLLLQELKTGVEGLGKICRPFLNAFEPSKWQSRGQAVDPFSIPGVSMVYERFSDIHPFELPPTWSRALDRCLAAVNAPEARDACNIYFVKGSKNTGKSTFARTLLNQLLGIYERVAYLECDLGQSDFTPGGMVALNVISRPIFGPPFTHPTLPISAHYIGASTPRSSPSHYLEAIQALLNVYRVDIQTPSDEYLANEDETSASSEKIRHIIPLIINTMGWSKGLGSDLTRKIEEWAQPTDVFTFAPLVVEDSPAVSGSTWAPRQTFSNRFGAREGDMAADDPTATLRTYLLDSPSEQGEKLLSGGVGYTAADHRTMTLLSYLHCTFPTLAPGLALRQVTAESWDTALPLVAMLPYEVECSKALDRLVLTGSGSEDVVVGEVGRVVNGALVGLVSCEEGAFAGWDDHGDNDAVRQQPEQQNERLPYMQQCPAPAPALSTCVGLALVRGVAPHLVDHTLPPAEEAEGGEGNADLELLTPVPPPMLSTARVFVKGEMELPVWGMLDFRNWEDSPVGGRSGVVEMEQGRTPFLQWGKNGAGAVGAERRRVRRNLMRRGQM